MAVVILLLRLRDGGVVRVSGAEPVSLLNDVGTAEGGGGGGG